MSRSKKKKTSGTAAALIIGLAIVACAAAAIVIFLAGKSKNPSQEGETARQETVAVTKRETESEIETVAETEDASVIEAKSMVEGMTLEEKIYQMFIIRPEALTGVDQVTAAGDMTKDAINDYPVGGLIYFDQNIETPDQLTEMLSNTQDYSVLRTALPMFLCVDEEGGTVARIAGNSNFDVPQFEDMRYIGGAGDSEAAYEVGTAIGTYLSAYGFNFDFAPVADVLTNPDNQVVYDRSFGTEPELVADMSWNVLRGLNDKNIIGVLKHYPGHGATLGDTHEGYAYTDKTLDALKEAELVPFMNGIEKGADMIMVGHISVPEIVGDNTPASLSAMMITDILKGELGFKGLVITDALEMEAIQQSYSSSEAAVMAVDAGVDILLMPADFHEAYQGVFDAVESGKISEARIDASVEKIVALKLRRLQ